MYFLEHRFIYFNQIAHTYSTLFLVFIIFVFFSLFYNQINYEVFFVNTPGFQLVFSIDAIVKPQSLMRNNILIALAYRDSKFNQELQGK